MASKTNVEARKGQKLARVKHYDAQGHEIIRAKIGVKSGRFGWLCEKCGLVQRDHYLVGGNPNNG